MRFAHFGKFAPNQSGQYETVKDLIRAERDAGYEAHFIDFDGKSNIGLKDDWLETENMDVARDCDLLFRHSLLPKKIQALGKPTIMTLHGRPESSFLLEHKKIVPVISEARKHKGPFLTFWPELVWYWEAILGRKVFYMPAPVDLNKYNPEGKKHKFKPSGKPNIVVMDMWREDVTPFNVIFAAARFLEQYAPDGRIHIYGCPENKAMLNLKRAEALGEVFGTVKGLENVYRAADFMVTPQVIATRTVREAMASGCPFVGGGGNNYTQFKHDPRDIYGYAREIGQLWESMQSHDWRRTAREMAEMDFKLNGETVRKVLDEISVSL